jgi:intraflagellar transport protein 46
LEQAEQNPAQIDQWLGSVNELHKTRPPPTVEFTKTMPDIETLMQEWPVEMEEAFNSIPLPGSDIDISLPDYAKLICGILDIPVQKLNNKKSIIEALHLLFSLYTEFKENPHFRHKKAGGEHQANLKSNQEVMQIS